MKKARWILLGCACLLLVSGCQAAGVSGSRKDPAAPDYVFTYAENQAEDYPTTQGAYRFADLVKEKTNGRILINVQADAKLGDEKSVIEQMQFGGIDFARVSISPLSSYVPELNILQMPFLYRDSDHMWKVLDGKIGRHFMDALDGSELVPLSWYNAGARDFYNSKHPIEKLEDMKGLKIRVQESELMTEMVQLLGAQATTMPYADVYSALETGVIDGAENNWPSYESTLHYEVAKYMTIDEHARVPELQICSQITWDKLSAEDQSILKECAQESALYERELWDIREKEAEKRVTSSGVLVYVLPEEERERFREAVAPLLAKYCGDEVSLVDEIVAEGK